MHLFSTCTFKALNVFCFSLHSSLCLWLWRSVVSWWRRGGWSTQASTESQGTTLQSPTCRRSSITRAWMISISRTMWVALSIAVALIKLSFKCHVAAVGVTTPWQWMRIIVSLKSWSMLNEDNYPSYHNLMFYRNGETSMWSAVCSSPSSENFPSLCSPMVGCFCKDCVCHLVVENENYNAVERALPPAFLQPLLNFSLLPADKYTEFIDANRTEDPVERLKVLKRLVSCFDN